MLLFELLLNLEFGTALYYSAFIFDMLYFVYCFDYNSLVNLSIKFRQYLSFQIILEFLHLISTF